jgi:hypothetical protein
MTAQVSLRIAVSTWRRAILKEMDKPEPEKWKWERQFYR